MAAYMDHKDLGNQEIPGERAREIGDAVRRVREQVAQAEATAGREPGSVQLLAATKTRDVGEIMAAIDAGVRLIGENRPQEVVAKADGLAQRCAQAGLALGTAAAAEGGEAGGGAAAGARVGFHLIGQLQSNKINKVMPAVDTVESVDTLALAEKLSRKAETLGRTMGILLEVNESGEEAKSGCAPEEAADMAYAIAAMPGVKLTGLMTIGAHVDDESTIRAGFAHLRGLRDQIRNSGEPGTASCTDLSMGMTHDLSYAIAEGSTIVRVGTAIFGERAFI
ncbi:YggS family pyridoxal phosphate-dependent enzyme [Bifidobacterium xylocopae]|uniref:Pyridoxal phosphate homeostasis protein n=1 Tax=Bifidobacterium xylocopae TaxID=2493119 RepID=A0A366KEC9_9BIFI|nr:YggS family pyridoxal phosphate-dependent enzyme [Bifidobacterium xylocopae]RBP99473.1 YggS family pyridoxal phosphate-dependent enzyme [Bifidobacterium xylocopae]